MNLPLMAVEALASITEAATTLQWDSPLVAYTLIALAFLTYFLTRESKYDLDKIPGPWKKAWPIVGNVPELLTPNHHRKFLEYSNTYGGITRVSGFWQNGIMVTDPKAAAIIMGPLKNEGALDKAAIYGPVNEMLEAHGHPNMFTSVTNERWKVVRKAVATAFSVGNIRKKYGVVLGRVNELIDRLRDLGPEQSVDVDQAALRVTLDVIGLAAFGHDYECVKQDVPPYNHLLRVLPRCFTEVELRIANPFRSLSIIPRSMFKYGEKGAANIKLFQAKMKALFEEMKARGPPSPDDMSIGAQLMRIRNTTDITDDQILSDMGILFVAGFETTGHTVSWTLFCVATNKGIQEQIAEELDAAGLLLKPGYKPRELEYEDLRKLNFLIACIKEAMRMYPVVSVGNARTTTKPTKIGPYMVPAGVLVGVPLYALHNTKHNWEDPTEFRPERWMKVPVESYVYSSRDPEARSSQSVTFMPFSEGPRNCVGQSLAKMEVIALLAKLLANFHFTLAPEMGGVEGVTSRESTHLTLQTKGTKGIRMNLTPRDQL